MEKVDWRWNPLHPEHMVPGSFWKLRDETSLYYLEDYRSIELYQWGYGASGYGTSVSFESEKVYFLVKIEELNGVYTVLFLDDTKTLEAKVAVGCWDNVFSLVQGSTNPVLVKRMFLGRITEEKLYAKLKRK